MTSKWVIGTATSEWVVVAVISKGVVVTILSEGVVIAVGTEGVVIAVAAEETVIIKSLFVRVYIYFNNIRMNTIRNIQRYICKRSSCLITFWTKSIARDPSIVRWYSTP